ncbi:MAG: site-specific integrase [Deltaproteobacteria bacterium]|jgi:integrase|nr:site-specific integrase [Deltaproteobacteria bacterium]
MLNKQRLSARVSSLVEALTKRQELLNKLQNPELCCTNRREKEENETSLTLKHAILQTIKLYWRNNREYKKGMNGRLRQMCEYFGENTPIQRITTEKIAAYTHWLEANTKNRASTINKKVMTLSKVLRTAYNLGQTNRMPRMYKLPCKSQRIRYLTKQEEEVTLKLFKSMTSEAHVDAFQVLIDTGFRLSELWGLTSEHVNFDVNAINLWEGTTKNGKARTVPMTARVREIMTRRCKEYPGKLWPKGSNSWFEHQWNRVRLILNKQKDRTWVPHVLRHTCCSRLVQAGVNLFLVQQWMGHKSLAITQLYAHHSPEHLRIAGECLENFTAGISEKSNTTK